MSVVKEISGVRNVSNSRRQLIFHFATAAGALGVLAVVGGRTDSATAGTIKTPQKAASYRDTPRGAARCDRCLFFVAPVACKVVAGAIVPTGSCDLFSPKS